MGRAASVLTLAVVLVACGGGGGGESAGTGPTGHTGTPTGVTGSPTGVTGSPTGTTASTEDLRQAKAAFCVDLLPFLAVLGDMNIITQGGAISTSNEKDLLFLIDVNREILRDTKTRMTIDAELLGKVGEEAVAEAATEAARLAGDVVSASDGLSLSLALDPDSLTAAEPPHNYSQEVLSEEFGNGYFDGWFDKPRAMDTAEYRLGYRTGREAGWRDDVPA
ncbi:MAG: hypothetical protein WB297_01495 [Actinomycetota bacterium]